MADLQDSMATANATFSYPPLPIGVDAIRLLELEPGDFHEPLICTLITAAFSTKPKYAALSYTWTDPYPDNAELPTTPAAKKISRSSLSKDHKILSEILSTSPESYDPTKQIVLNRCAFNIQHNLHLALLYLRSLTHPLTLWVDSVCVNQADTAERSSQVAMMAFIYTRALTVVAWLGLEEWDENHDNFSRMAMAWKAGHSSQFAESMASATTFRRSQFRMSEDPSHQMFRRLAESTYWERLWIVQEVSLARTLVFAYGSQMWMYGDLKDWKVFKKARRSVRGPKSDLDEGSKVFEPMMQLLDTRDARHSDETTLANLIHRFAKSTCSEPRDRVYGLLGLANDTRPFLALGSSGNLINKCDENPSLESEAIKSPQISSRVFIRVDYSRSFYNIWADVLTFSFFNNSEMEMPYRFSDHKFRRQADVVRVAGIVQRAFGLQIQEEIDHLHITENVQILKPFLDSLKIDDTESHQCVQRNPSITALGFWSGKVVEVGPSYRSLVASFRANQVWLSCWENRYSAPKDLEILRKRNERYTSEILAFSDDEVSRVQDIRSSETIAWNVAEANRPHATDTSYKAEYSKIWDAVQRGTPNSPRICLGTDYLIALVPPSTRSGDILVQFWNSSSAIVMRPIHADNAGVTSSLMLIGQADVADGIERVEEIISIPLQTDRWARNEFGSPILIDIDLRTLQIISAAKLTYTTAETQTMGNHISGT